MLSQSKSFYGAFFLSQPVENMRDFDSFPTFRFVLRNFAKFELVLSSICLVGFIKGPYRLSNIVRSRIFRGLIVDVAFLSRQKQPHYFYSSYKRKKSFRQRMRKELSFLWFAFTVEKVRRRKVTNFDFLREGQRDFFFPFSADF